MKLLRFCIMLLGVFFISRQAQAQCNNTNFNGVLFYTLSGTVKSSGANVSYQELGKVTADGNGSLTGQTTTSTAGALATMPVSGTYAIQANCSGTATLNTTANVEQLALQVVNGGSLTLASVTSSGAGELADGRFFRAANATGSQCGNGSLQGAYGLLISGGTFSADGVRTATQIDTQAVFDGKGGMTWTGVLTTGVSLGSPTTATGTYFISPDCSGLAQLNIGGSAANYILARVQDGSLLVMENDAHTSMSGQASPQQLQSVLPQFVFGGGWYSALYFSNGTSTTVSFLVTFTADNGTPMAVPGIGNSKLITLAPLGSAMVEAPNVGTLVQGYASVSLPAGVSGYGVFRQSVAGKPDQEAVVGLNPANSTSNILTWDDTNFTTSVAMVNSSSVATTVTITVWDSNGNLLGTSTQGLAPGNKIESAMRGFQGLSAMAGQRGSALFTVPVGNVSVLGLRFGSAAFTSIPTTEQQ